MRPWQGKGADAPSSSNSPSHSHPTRTRNKGTQTRRSSLPPTQVHPTNHTVAANTKTTPEGGREGDPYTCRTLFVDDDEAYILFKRAEAKLLRRGAVFRSREGWRVAFNELEWDVQCAMLTELSRPIWDKEAFVREMPTGRWSDFPRMEGKVKEQEVRGRMDSKVEVGGEGRKGNRRTEVDEEGGAGGDPPASSAVKPAADSPPRSTDPSPRNSSPLAKENSTRYKAHAVFEPVDATRTLWRRALPGVELAWHPSKTRESYSKRLWRELQAEGKQPWRDNREFGAVEGWGTTLKRPAIKGPGGRSRMAGMQ